MKIIDAHLHFKREGYFDNIARAAEHENTAANLAKEYRRLNIIGGVVMGNEPVENVTVSYPAQLFYCVGLGGDESPIADTAKKLPYIEEHLRRKSCVGIKLYPGYQHFFVGDDFLRGVYKLAARYDKPVAVHTGLMAGSATANRYSHPKVIETAAAKFPTVRFVMCHFGEPYFADAAAVLKQHQNVFADLSGMLEGKIPDMERFFVRYRKHFDDLTEELSKLNTYDRLMFGTDWPLANLSDYIDFTKRIIPTSEHEKVFAKNAVKIYGIFQNERISQ